MELAQPVLTPFYIEVARLLSIDYGAKRTGLAVTDAAQIVPGGLCTVLTKDLLKFLTDYVSREPVERFIVGLPKQTNGQDSDNLQRVRSFVGNLQKALPNIPVTWYDERFTSVLAHQTMLDAGLGKKARQNKALVDEISATIILRDYMESNRRF